MILKLATFTLGLVMIGVSLSGFVLMRTQPGEKLFPEARPYWLRLICWINLTCAILSGIGFYQAPDPMASLVTGIAVLSAAKFYFFYFSYADWQKPFVLLWNNRSALYVILGSSFFVGALMVFTAGWIL